MTTYVLDASAVLRFFDREAGCERVAEVLSQAMARKAGVAVSAIQWGEIVGAVRKKRGVVAELRAMGILCRFPLQIVDATAEHAMHAAEMKVDRKIAYADAFAATLAMELQESVLLTADYGFKALEDLIPIEYLPQK